MTRTEAIRAYREARDEADMILVGYMLENPGESLQGLCKEADPENWHALEQRVSRRLKKARSEDVLHDTSAPKPNQKASIRSAKAAIRQHPELADDLVADDDVNVAISKARQRHDEEARSVGELKDPERRHARQYDEQRTDLHKMGQFRRWLRESHDRWRTWEWTDDLRDEWTEMIDSIRTELDITETDPDIDTRLEEITR